mmetsp:Transcript_36859/g.83378  ORF Transcript_36859/g.83378 Transcript_36859/m.83378 type:complete len:307 (-) Transcript_36859:12-932(-)
MAQDVAERQSMTTSIEEAVDAAVCLQVAPGESGALACLNSLHTIKVREKVRYLEALSALLGQEVELCNKYQVYAPDDMGDDLFYAVEHTNILWRNTKQFCGDCSPWSVDVYYSKGWGTELAYHLERPATFTCCCMNRPVVYMTDVEGNEIGSLRDPFPWCAGLTINARNPDTSPAFTMDSGCCSLGIFCPTVPCNRCDEVEMDIEEADSGRKVGTLRKTAPGLIRALLAPDVDDYHIEFGGVARPEHKALLMAAALFIDFRFFNDNANDGEAHLPIPRFGDMGSSAARMCKVDNRSCTRSCTGIFG